LTLSVYAQQKYALVIGNSNYEKIPKLNNPVNDAGDIKTALKNLGWTVECLSDANSEQIEKAVTRLTGSLSKSKNSYGFVFFAGHAVQSNDVNYLIPVDANYQSEAILRSRAISVQKLLEDLYNAENELNIIVLDACRDNPFSWNKSRNRGLAAVQRYPANSIIAFSADAGAVAEDSKEKNSFYTTHLLNNLKTSGISVQELFDKTGNSVVNASEERQRPSVYGQFKGIAYMGSLSEPNPSPNRLVSLYEQLVYATGTSTVTVIKDEIVTSPITIAVALSLTLRGDKAGRTILGAGYTDNGFSYQSSITVERGVTLILENIALFGVNINVKQGGTLVMNDASMIKGCLSCGVNVDGGTFIMNKGSAVTSNGSSGVIIFGGTFTMNDGRIADNSDQWGGGVNVNEKGTFNMKGGLIENNIASEHGGGVFVNGNSSFNMQNGSISRNRADKNGGGVYVGNKGVFRMTGGIINGLDSTDGSNTNTAAIGNAVYNDSVSINKEYNSTVTKL